MRQIIYRAGPFMDSDEASGKAVEELLSNAKILWEIIQLQHCIC